MTHFHTALRFQIPHIPLACAELIENHTESVRHLLSFRSLTLGSQSSCERILRVTHFPGILQILFLGAPRRHKAGLDDVNEGALLSETTS